MNKVETSIKEPVFIRTLTLSPPEGPYGSTVFIENYEFFRGKAFRILIDLKGHAHCIYLFVLIH